MKKIIGILGVAVFAATMFLNTNAVNGSNSDTSLANLLTLNSANAECVSDQNPIYNIGRCSQISGECIPVAYYISNGCKP